jgi:hypothetical protein
VNRKKSSECKKIAVSIYTDATQPSFPALVASVDHQYCRT